MAFASCHALRLPLTQRTARTPLRRQVARAALGRVLVVGAGDGIGLEVARLLHSRGNAAHVAGSVCSGHETGALTALADTVLELDVGNEASVERVMTDARADCLICCVASGSRALTDAALRAGVQRYVLVSALGAGDSENDVPMQAYFSLRESLVAFSLAESAVRESTLNWTIARPGPVVEGPTTGGAVFSEDHRCYGTISAGDIADAVVRAADSPSTVRKTLTVVDKGNVLLTSPYVRPLEFWEEFPFDEFVL